MKDKKIATILIVAVALLITMSVAYALLQQNLIISFTSVKSNALTWNVHFKVETLSAATIEGTSATGRSCGTMTIASASSTTATLGETTLSKPGDGCIYKLTIQNEGDIVAKLKTITLTAPTGGPTCTKSGAKIVCGNITYLLTTEATGATELTTSNLGNIAAKSGSTPGNKNVYVVVRYTGSNVSSTAVTLSNAKFELLFEQL